MKVIKKEETGEIIVNGRLGTLTAWLRWLQPWVITGLILPGLGWSYVHYHQHKDIEEFAARGQRVYSSTGEDISTDQFEDALMLKVSDLIDAKVPPESVEKRLDALEKAVSENHAILLRILEK